MTDFASYPAILEIILQGVVTTVVITVVAFLIGAVAGLPIALFRLSESRTLRAVGMIYVEFVRGIPALVWLMIVFYGVGQYVELEPVPAACIALGAVAAAYMAEIYRSAIASVARGQSEAAAALGLTGRQRFFRVIAPQGLGVAIPPSATFGIGLIKESAAASVIGAADIAFRATSANVQGYPALPVFVLAGLLYFLISIPVAVLARSADHKIRTRAAVA